ncbi:S-ribosylhomocysteine lyase [Bowdeniella massiliensis]|uniref:S-ribosylhomocysteine lyase n=1 Tax=Bowdeniella massiliensis TaxID=2932264 RepID=UPI002028B026|nr:S-ribosylhomocysteine lyase [Bowdeniella massiliensis]
MTTPKMNVESFNLDHTKVAAPYVRVADRKVLPAGDVLVKYDVRFTQPNRAHLEMPTIHSLEHTFAEKVRNHADYVIDFSPMGCQTGFYLLVSGDHEDQEIFDLIAAGLSNVLAADEVPAANEVQCGWGASHDLAGAKAAAKAMLEGRDVWHEVMA